MKKKMLISGLAVLAIGGFFVSTANATPVNVSGGNGEQTLADYFTSEGWNIDPNADQISPDTTWHITEEGSNATALMKLEISSNANSNKFGIYDSTGKHVQLFDGSAEAQDKATIGFIASGLFVTFYDFDGNITTSSGHEISSTFGFYIETSSSKKFYSDYAQNSDGQADHMVAFAGTGANGLSVNHSILAFEDAPSTSWDYDYNDMVIMVESMSPVPEPTTMLLFGTGLAGLAGVARRKRS